MDRALSQWQSWFLGDGEAPEVGRGDGSWAALLFIASLFLFLYNPSPVLIMKHPEWKMAEDEQMFALVSLGTWELVEAPPSLDVVARPWVFNLKYRPDGTIDRYKARLVAKSFT
ncbi:hypothetical protein BUALT_Bualt17G0004400 [Buddleja alternifolia]|uniref:Uncharacterized protein n=1 Tax=Buddleja alternifolia TaxID=168488 RepID=A0AAV6WAM3_9LAMI|nr:hypothetical protein BUALT_Bualt17G0004400 [Buddleja alternifolia]